MTVLNSIEIATRLKINDILYVTKEEIDDYVSHGFLTLKTDTTLSVVDVNNIAYVRLEDVQQCILDFDRNALHEYQNRTALSYNSVHIF